MLETRHIVVVEDDEIMGASLVQRLELEGATVQWFRQTGRALAAIRTPRRPVDAVICDIKLPDGSGEDLYATLLRTGTPPPFLFITGQGRIDQAVRMIRSGAADYIAKPFEMAAFLERLSTVIRPPEPGKDGAFTGISAAARAVDRQAAAAAAHDAPVLILGAAGLGKSRLADRIHGLSDRRAAPLVRVDAGGAGEGGLAAAIGRAGEGTLLVVGIERLPESGQALLLAGLREGPFRLIATGATALAQGGPQARLRTDLLAALRAHTIVVPPLAERPEDALWLATSIFRDLNRRRARPLAGLSAAAEAAIRAHAWPDNGREIRARMLRAIDTAATDLVLPVDLFPEGSGEETIRPLAEVRDAAERSEILSALERTGGHVGEAARLLHVSRTTLWEKMQKLGL
ncbi:MAG: response regulator [Rhodobacteraceae bacterium]|nr:response regulator [Paracoccaceae bacterium]